jgi:zinc transporter ZupT
MNNADYRALEPGVVANITSLKYPVGGVSSFFASSSFLYTLLFSAIVVSAGGMIIYGAILRLVPSASSEAKSREIFWRVLKGVVGTFSFALIFLTFNRDLLRGDIDFSVLGVGAKNMI